MLHVMEIFQIVSEWLGCILISLDFASSVSHKLFVQKNNNNKKIF